MAVFVWRSSFVCRRTGSVLLFGCGKWPHSPFGICRRVAKKNWLLPNINRLTIKEEKPKNHPDWMIWAILWFAAPVPTVISMTGVSSDCPFCAKTRCTRVHTNMTRILFYIKTSVLWSGAFAHATHIRTATVLLDSTQGNRQMRSHA